MPEVVTDTSPIQYLYQSNLLDLLPALYGQVLMPQAVVYELAQGRSQGVRLPDPGSIPWLKIVQVQPLDLVAQFPDLRVGEQEVITLAVKTPDSLAILDDAFARRCARDLNVNFTGTLGIILKAKQSGLVEVVEPILDQLNALGFRFDSNTRISVLKLAGELGVE